MNLPLLAKMSDGDLMYRILTLAGLVLGVFLQIRILSKSDKPQEISPNPLRVRADEEAATKAELQRHIAEAKKDHENIFAKIGGMERGLRAETDLKVGELRGKMDRTATDESSVMKEAEMHTQQLATLDSDIKQLLAR
ncbi:MAG TPA: hypothetical protein VMB21_02090 [Candidatus Limnocylindria bacterium]|nr:hypothetical protein [Candidatus Limnocylindria bacterium]